MVAAVKKTAKSVVDAVEPTDVKKTIMKKKSSKTNGKVVVNRSKAVESKEKEENEDEEVPVFPFAPKRDLKKKKESVEKVAKADSGVLGENGVSKKKRKDSKTTDKKEKTVDKSNTKKTDTKQTEKLDKNENAIWIGNLPYNVTHALLKDFFATCGKITRIKLPTSKKNKTHNRGFAYVNFSNKEGVQNAIKCSDKDLAGRKVLIKDATVFERQQTHSANVNVFIGNLPFDVTDGKLFRTFGIFGQIERVFIARFDDSDRCKGFAYIRFAELASATQAVQRGRLQFSTKGESRRVLKLEYSDPNIFESAAVVAVMEQRREKYAAAKEARAAKKKSNPDEPSTSKPKHHKKTVK